MRSALKRIEDRQLAMFETLIELLSPDQLRYLYRVWNATECSTPPTPSPTGTELALDEAKRHITILTSYWMESPGWTDAANDARTFISGVPP